MWEGGECWIIGGGSSLTKQFNIPDKIVQSVRFGKLLLSSYSPYLSSIHHKHVIAINVAYLIGNWIDIVFFGDNEFFMENQDKLNDFPGLKVTCHPRFANVKGIKYLKKGGRQPRGLSDNPSSVIWNANSGSASISMAANMGVKRIVLVGFDMNLDEDGNQWFHSEYGKGKPVTPGTEEERRKRDRQLPFGRHLVGFPGIANDAKRRGVEILNANPDSAIEVFRKVTVKEVL